MRKRPDDQERARDRAGGEDERDRDREREAENGDQHQERDRQRDRLPAPEVAREDAVEVALDRRLPGHICRHSARGAERAADRVRVPLRVLQVECRLDVAPEDPAPGPERARVAGRDHAGGAPEAPSGVLALGRIGGPGGVEDNDEGPVGALAEAARQDRRRAVGIRARDGERVGEEWLQVLGGPAAGDERDEPEQQDEDSVAEDDAGPTLGHVRSLPRSNP